MKRIICATAMTLIAVGSLPAASAQTLTVTFHNGKRYRYDGVSSQLADGFQGSGSYLRQHVAPQCSYKCLDGNHDHD
jgi:hypothetical protein